jgi:hypothetical protein
MFTFGTAILILAIVFQACLFHFLFWERVKPLVKMSTSDDVVPERKFNIVDLLSLFLLFSIVPLLGYAWFILIQALTTNHSQTGNTIITLEPEPAFWMLGALFLAIIGAALPADLVARQLLKERYEALMLQSLRRNKRFSKYRYSPRLLPYMNVLVAALAIAIAVLGSDWYVRFNQDSIVINPLLSFRERTYQYSDVAEIATIARFKAPNGNLKPRPHIATRFVDDWWWTSREGFRSNKVATDQAIIELLKGKTGISVTTYDLLP